MVPTKVKDLKGLIKVGDYLLTLDNILLEVTEVKDDFFRTNAHYGCNDIYFDEFSEPDVTYISLVDFETALLNSRLTALQNAKRLDEIERNKIK